MKRLIGLMVLGLIVLGLIAGWGASRLSGSRGHSVTEEVMDKINEVTGRARGKIAEIKNNATAAMEEAIA